MLVFTENKTVDKLWHDDEYIIFFKVALYTMALTLYYGARDLPSCLLEIYDDIFTIVNVIWAIAFLYVSMMYIEII